jgi:hypothetical protein
MWIIPRIIVCRAADASGGQNQRASSQLDQVLLVTVTAEDSTGVNISQPFLDNGQWRPDEPAPWDLLDKILIVIRGSAVTGKDAMLGINRFG